jgi:hypothetical protein
MGFYSSPNAHILLVDKGSFASFVFKCRVQMENGIGGER